MGRAYQKLTKVTRTNRNNVKRNTNNGTRKVATSRKRRKV